MYKAIKKYNKIPVDPLGYYNKANKNKPVIVPNGNITMKGLTKPIIGTSLDTGEEKIMYPNEEYIFDNTENVLEQPLMKSGGLIKRADGSYSKPGLWDNIRKNKGSGKKPTAQMLEQERKINKMQGGGFQPLSYITPNNSDNTRISIPPRKLTKEELAKNAIINQKQQEASNNYELKQKNQRDINRASKGDFSGKNPFHIEDKLRMFPESYGGWGDVVDEYINPAFFVGKMASNVGNSINRSIAEKSIKPFATSLVEPLIAGAMGFDPAGSLLKKAPIITEPTKNLINQTYKINPWAFKPNKDFSYRMIGKEGLTDALESGVIRSKKQIAYPEPYFGKGKIYDGEYSNPKSTAYNPQTGQRIPTNGYPGPYMVESKAPMKGVGAWADDPNPMITTPLEIPKTTDPNYTFYKQHWLEGYKKVPVEKKPIFSQPEIKKEPINYYDMPGFKERNPKITDWENYKGDVKLRDNVEITNDLKPFIKMRVGGFQPLFKTKPIAYSKTTSDYVNDFDRQIQANNIQSNTESPFADMPQSDFNTELSTAKNAFAYTDEEGQIRNPKVLDTSIAQTSFPKTNLVQEEANINNSILNKKAPVNKDPFTEKKETIEKNNDYSYIPSLVNGVLGAMGNRLERNRQDEYTRNNLANPFNYLPKNNNTNNYVNKGVQIAEEGGFLDDEDEDDWDFEDEQEEIQEPLDDSLYLSEELMSQQEDEEEPLFIPEEDEDIDFSAMSNNTVSAPTYNTTLKSTYIEPTNLDENSKIEMLAKAQGTLESGNNYNVKASKTIFGKYQVSEAERKEAYKNLPELKQTFKSFEDYDKAFHNKSNPELQKQVQETTYKKYLAPRNLRKANGDINTAALMHYLPKAAELYKSGKLDLNLKPGDIAPSLKSYDKINPTFGTYLNRFKKELSR